MPGCVMSDERILGARRFFPFAPRGVLYGTWGVGIFDHQGIPPWTFASSSCAAVTAAISPSIAAQHHRKIPRCTPAPARLPQNCVPGAAAPSFKLQYSGSAESAVEEYYGREFTFYLRAHDKKTGVTLARATCSADTHGAVTALTTTEAGNASVAKTL